MCALVEELSARAEFLHEGESLAAISARLAEHGDEAVHTAEEQAANTPESWPKNKHRTRRVLGRRFKFPMVYSHGENEFYVVAIAPTKRRPGYWRLRLKGA